MFERFKVLPQLWRSGWLSLRLLRDPRVPMAAKLIFGATVLYMLSPVDVVPDWLPVLGQADDLLVLMAGLNLFLRACPTWLVEEHEDAIGSGSRDRVYSRSERAAPAGAAPGAGSTIDGEYQRVR